MGYLFCYCVHKIKIWLMRFLANATFSRSQKSHKARTLCNWSYKFSMKKRPEKDSKDSYHIKLTNSDFSKSIYIDLKCPKMVLMQSVGQ